MHPILFKIGGVPIYAHGFFLCLGLLIGLLMLIMEAQRRRWPKSELIPITLAAFVGGMIGARSRMTDRCDACHAHLPLSEHTPRDLARHVFMINTRDFMDPWTFNVKNVMKCWVEFLVPDGRMIPFCAYNSVGCREQVTGELMAQRASRKDAKAHMMEVRS